MSFSQSDIADVRVIIDGSDLFVAWTASVTDGTIFQVYVDHRLAWFGTALRCHVPIPAGGAQRDVWVEVGTVGGDERTRDYSSQLSAPGGGR